MLKDIDKEMKSAQHLLYVSLKYTRTGDVMVNLMKRWAKMVELSLEQILIHSKKINKTTVIPHAPKLKQRAVIDIFKNNKTIKETITLHSLFRKVDRLHAIRRNEFRKNVSLTLIDGDKEVIVDLEKLKEWEIIMNDFIKIMLDFLKKKK
jgi:hypothetical protein